MFPWQEKRHWIRNVRIRHKKGWSPQPQSHFLIRQQHAAADTCRTACATQVTCIRGPWPIYCGERERWIAVCEAHQRLQSEAMIQCLSSHGFSYRWLMTQIGRLPHCALGAGIYLLLYRQTPLVPELKPRVRPPVLVDTTECHYLIL